MHALFSRRMIIGLALLVVLALNLTLESVTHLPVHAAPARASMTLSKVTGPPTTTLTVKGSGFGSSETVIATFDHTTIVGSTRTSRLGSFSLGITIPATALPGWQSIQATGRRSGLTASRTFRVNTDWSQFGYDRAQSRTNPYENVLSRTNVSRLTLDWRYPTGSLIYSSPAVVNGVLYIGSEDGSVYALDVKTGTKVWSYFTGNVTYSSIYSSPVVANGVVYIGSNDWNLYALDARTGTRLWSFATGGNIISSPAVVNGVVYIGSYDHSVYALDARTGTKLWSYATGNVIYTVPAVAHGVVYIGSEDDSVYAVDAKTGTRLWSYTSGNLIVSSPTVANGVVYVGSEDFNVYAFHLPGKQP